MDTETSSAATDPQSDLPRSEMESPEPADLFFFNTRVPMWKYIVRMWLIAFLPSVVIAITLQATGILTVEN